MRQRIFVFTGLPVGLTICITSSSSSAWSGEKIAIVGLNGAGKTTLIKLLCGFYLPRKGEILVDGKPVSAYNIEEYYQNIAAVFQNIDMLALSIEDNIAFGDIV